MTSHDMVLSIRRLVMTRRVGHAGTLDPFATGLLPMLVGRATRLVPYLGPLPKHYRGTLRLGQRTPTDDPTTPVTVTDDGWRSVDDARLAAAVHAHTGSISQVPPAYSAKKVGGRRAYRLARQGQAVALEPRTVIVHRFEIVRRRGADVDFAVAVASGTYIRALARDLGEMLGCGAHLTSLRRVGVGRWRVEDAVPPDALTAGQASLLPPAAAVEHLLTQTVDDRERELLRHGRSVQAKGACTGPVAMLADEQLVAVAEPSGPWLRPRVVLET